MSRRTITTPDYTYVTAPDIDLPVAQRTWAIVIAQLTDELTGTTPDGVFRLTCDNKNFKTRFGSGGFAGLAAIPAKALPLLATQNYQTKLSVNPEEYVADSRDLTIPLNPLFPAVFTPLDLGVWPFHRDPISIYGSVNLDTAAGPVAVGGASVSLTALWRMVGQPVAALDAVTLNGVLAAARPAGSTVEQLSMTPVGAPYQLVTEAEAGAASVLLSNTVGLAVGSVLGFDTTDPDLTEYATVAAISGSINPAQPATVTLPLPLSFLHFALTPVSRMTPGAPGAANPLGVAAIAGDRVALLNHPVAGIASGSVVAINGGASPTEYRIAQLFAVTSDARGNYRLPLLSRVAQLELTANDGVHLPVTQQVIPQYGNQDNRVDFLLN